MTEINSKKDKEREELRGLFTLGLLAVLITTKFQNKELMVTFGQITIDLIPFINFTIITWSVYAFFMVVGLSDDVVGKTTAEIFQSFSKVFLQIDFIYSAIIGMVYFIFGYPARSFWIFWLIVVSSLFGVLISLRKIKIKSLKETWKNLKANKLDLLKNASIISFLLFLTALFSYPDEQYLYIFFCLGAFSFLFFCLIKDKQSKTK